MRFRTHLIVALTAASMPELCAAEEQENWTIFAHDLQHSSFNSLESSIAPLNIRRLQPAWISSVGAPIAAAASLADGTLYFGAWDGNFYAMNTKDGTVLWKQFTGLVPPPADATCFPVVGVSGQAAVVGKNVYVGGGDSAVYAFDRATGGLLWREQIADPTTGAYLWSSITVYNNALYIGVASLADCPLTRGALVRIDLNNPHPAQIKYLVPEDQTGAGMWSTAAIDAATNTVFVTTGNGDQDPASGWWGSTFLSLDATTLEVKSYYFLPGNPTVEEDIDWGSSPTLFVDSNGVPLAGATGKNGGLYVLRRQDLTPVWHATLAVQCIDPVQGCGSISTPAFDGKRLYVGAGVADPNAFATGSLYALDPTTGNVLWSVLLDGTVLAPVTVANGLVFAATTMGLEVHDASSGRTVWTDRQLGALYSQPIVANGFVYTTYVNGDVIGWHIAEPLRKPRASVESPPAH